MRLYLTSSDDFLTFLLSNAPSNVVCRVLSDIHTKGIDSKYLLNNYANYFSPAHEDKKKIAFLPVNRFGLCNNWDASKRMMIKPGKLFNKIVDIKLLHWYGITQKDLEVFSSLYTSRFVGGNITVVSGTDIQKYYMEDMYGSHGGSLWDSCMRHEGCYDYMQIYALNPEVCSMAIMKDDKGKIDGRALIWTTVDGLKVMDRVYYNREYHTDTFIRWAKEKNMIYKVRQSYSCNEWYVPDKDKHYHKKQAPELCVQLTKGINYDYYPYMDSLYNYNLDDNKLCNNEEGGYPEVQLRDTGGNYEDENSQTCRVSGERMRDEQARYCIWHDDYIHEDYAIFLEDRNAWIWEDKAVYIERRCVSIHTDDAVYIDSSGEYEHIDDTIELKNGSIEFIDDAICFEESYYSKDECIEVHNGEMIPEEHTALLSDGRYAWEFDPKLIFCEEDGTYYLTN